MEKNRQQGKVRFIRKNGRLIPIRAKSLNPVLSKKAYTKDPYGAAAKSSASLGALSGVSGAAAVFAKGPKLRMAGALGGVGFGALATINSVNRIRGSYALGGKKEGGGFTGWLATGLTGSAAGLAASVAGVGVGVGAGYLASKGAGKLGGLARLLRRKKKLPKASKASKASKVKEATATATATATKSRFK